MGGTHNPKPFSSTPSIIGVILTAVVAVVICELFPAGAAGILEIFTVTKADFYLILLFAVLFVVIWKLFEVTLFGPYMELFEAREAASEGAETVAEKALTEAQTLEQDYQQQLHAARVEAMHEKIVSVRETSTEASSIISAAENDSAEKIRKAREETEASLEALRGTVMNDADQMVEEIVSTLKEPAASVSEQEGSQQPIQQGRQDT